MSKKVVILVELDYGGNDRGYILYEIDAELETEAEKAVIDAKEAFYDDKDDSANRTLEDFIEMEFEKSGIKARILNYDVVSLDFYS